MGRLNDPLLHIDLENWVPDKLHLMLRITDILTRNLIIAAANDDYKNGRRSKDILHGPMVKKLLKEINSCGVSLSIHDYDKKIFSFTSLVGGDKLKLLQRLPSKLKNCQPADFYITAQKLWTVSTHYIVVDSRLFKEGDLLSGTFKYTIINIELSNIQSLI